MKEIKPEHVDAIENAQAAWCEWCKNSVSHYEGCPGAPMREPTDEEINEER